MANKYLSPEKGLGSLSKVGVKDDQSFPGGRLRLKLNHVNINCREEKTGYTPLILAVLNGSKEFVDDILFHSADVDVQDIKGNTALHMAVFGGKMEIIDLLLQNRAEVNVQNSDGNTPLHIASQIEGDRVHMLLKLLTKGADHTIMNRDHKEALDLAIMFKRTDAVSILLDHDHGLEDSKRTTTEPNTQAMLEASIRGYKEGMELLLDYGYDPNTLDKEMDSTALQEAVRYNRIQEVWCYSGSTFSEDTVQRNVAPGNYPILPNDPSWTQNSPDYCNSCTPNGPNTNILDGTALRWFAHSNFKKGRPLSDPQTFTDFTARSRYWRILLLDNFGGKCICFQGIKLYGADNRIRKLLEENSMENYADDIIALGYNTYKKFLLISDEAIQEVVSDFSDKEIILKSLERDRPKGVSIKGKSVVTLLSNSETEPSKATFSGIVIDTQKRKIQPWTYPGRV
ncbi:ANS1A-like protein [Mya arenaria]|uniref:ANS1A-like protein n=1 Tax=Mya arenaria TaxID=6604 RepID=A0ABY7G0B8_MYAAR|nr:ANS1A-like protein [Mya arenaria]